MSKLLEMQRVLEKQSFLFVRNALMANTSIDLELTLQKNGLHEILDYEVSIKDITVNADHTLEETIRNNYRWDFSLSKSKKHHGHNGIFLVTNRATARELAKGIYQGRIIAIEEKEDWYSISGQNKLLSMLQNHRVNKANMNRLEHLQANSAQMKKLRTYIRSEGEQYKALIGLAHVIHFYVSRLNYNQALQQQLSKLPRWY